MKAVIALATLALLACSANALYSKEYLGYNCTGIKTGEGKKVSGQCYPNQFGAVKYVCNGNAWTGFAYGVGDVNCSRPTLQFSGTSSSTECVRATTVLGAPFNYTAIVDCSSASKIALTAIPLLFTMLAAFLTFF